MAYEAMKKLITNENSKYTNEAVTKEAYDLWAKGAKNKLDVFFACDRITLSQYEELTRMLITTDAKTDETSES